MELSTNLRKIALLAALTVSLFFPVKSQALIGIPVYFYSSYSTAGVVLMTWGAASICHSDHGPQGDMGLAKGARAAGGFLLMDEKTGSGSFQALAPEEAEALGVTAKDAEAFKADLAKLNMLGEIILKDLEGDASHEERMKRLQTRGKEISDIGASHLRAGTQRVLKAMVEKMNAAAQN